MQHYDYRPRGVCPMKISFDLEGDTVHNVSFLGCLLYTSANSVVLAK